jgi:hypothetical protein
MTIRIKTSFTDLQEAGQNVPDAERDGSWSRAYAHPGMRVDDLERCHACDASVAVYESVCPACNAPLIEKKLETLRRLRDEDWVTGEAFVAVEQFLLEGAEPRDRVPRTTIRKRVGDLRPEDLARIPIWEFALDDEGEEGHDEEMVEPRQDLDRADPANGMFIVLTEFVSADGTRFDGYASPEEEAQPARTQPTIVTADGHVGFWFGAVVPTSDRLEACYRLLGKAAAELFPVSYRALAEHGGAPLEGEIAAFMHYESIGSERVVEVT